jgi:hypothetical protein
MNMAPDTVISYMHFKYGGVSTAESEGSKEVEK